MIGALITQGVFMIASFFIGYYIKPRKKAKSNKDAEKPQRDREHEILETMLANIDAYDGTGYGQRDIPYE